MSVMKVYAFITLFCWGEGNTGYELLLEANGQFWSPKNQDVGGTIR